MEVEPVDTALAYVWIIATILVVIVIGLFYVILPRLPSRRDYLHVFVASLLATRVLFCGFVLITAAVVTLKKNGWDIISCQVAFWGWTTSWLTDCLTVLAALICGFILLRKTRKDRRTHSDICVAVIWVVATITASCLILVRDEIDDKSTSRKYSTHCWTLPYTHQQLFGLSFILVYLIASIFITAIVSILGICILPVYRKPESVSETDGPQLTRYHNNVNNYINGKKQVTFVGVSNGNVHTNHTDNKSSQDVQESARSDGGSTATYNSEERPKRPSFVEPLDLDGLNSARSVTSSQEESSSSEMDKLDRVNILCTISSLTVFLNLIPQSIVLGISLLRESPVVHGEDILLACGVLHSLLLPAGLSIASRPYRKALVQLLTPSSKKLHRDGTGNNVAAITPSRNSQTPADDYVILDIPQIQVISATPQISTKNDHSTPTKPPSSPSSKRRPNRSASSIWTRDEDIRRRRAMASIKRTQSNQTMREWIQNLRNSMIESDKVDDDLRNKRSTCDKKIVRRQSTHSENSDNGGMGYNDSDINDVLDTLDEGDEEVLRNVVKEAEANSSPNTPAPINSAQLDGQDIYYEVTSTLGRSRSPGLDNPDYCCLEDINVIVQNKTPFHVSQKYTLPDEETKDDRLRYIIQGLEEAGRPFVIDHRGLVHVFDHPDNLPKSLDTTLDTINRSHSPLDYDAGETPQDEALYIDLYARATNPFNKEWQPVYADLPSLNNSDLSEAEIIAITYKGRRPSTQAPLSTNKKKSNNPFLTTSFLKKLMTKKVRNEPDHSAHSHLNHAYVPSERNSPAVWETSIQPEPTQQLQYHTLGYHGAYVTSNNPFTTSSPIDSSMLASNPFHLPNDPNSSCMDDSVSTQGTNPFRAATTPGVYTATTPGGYNSPSYGSTGRTSGEKRRRSLLPFSIMDFLRSKSENLAVYDNGQAHSHPSNTTYHGNTSHDYYNYNNRTSNGNNPFIIKVHDYARNDMYSTDYV